MHFAYYFYLTNHRRGIFSHRMLAFNRTPAFNDPLRCQPLIVKIELRILAHVKPTRTHPNIDPLPLPTSFYSLDFCTILYSIYITQSLYYTVYKYSVSYQFHGPEKVCKRYNASLPVPKDQRDEFALAKLMVSISNHSK